MSQKARITDSLIEQVWELYNKGYDHKTIAFRLGISQTSALRCVTALVTASTGKFVEYAGLLQDSHHIADYVNKKFNLTATAEKSSKHNEEQDLITAINLLAEAINRQTALFDGFIKKLEK